MVKVWLVVGIAVIVVTVYALVECVTFDRGRIRGLPRWVWVFVIVLVPVVGALLWLFIGRGSNQSSAPGRGPSRQLAPDDDPDFLKSLGRDRLQEERIRQMEQELADLDKPDATDKPDRPGKGQNSGPGKGQAAGNAGPSTGQSTGPAKGPAAAEPKKTTDPGEGELPGRRDA
ncbi:MULTISPECIES: PLDc N-terminal domain-containing protein [unclassified Cryobacterium]|uniref:PLDc N-terminal domain-containing protein n=1 Tax=unclassified Cryobacterium TaxID=2649013 RepID=UPI002AB38A0A|nr:MULTISPECIES: PLDc N-terminal domain-containing protein [unclassified Cryobacterium]MDY7529387.1 PLDc N-terminal domain-containing protein [Cryobacterium sp. 10C2]MDY7558462.1 PLDc N-terminal domain-containing protein [Cryobacterium sp. 10C3]MEB0203490.1 PLDc N-terminal domain-containing protein [Cryobacterium sp. 5I3]MEB0292085.1 PLDc N-terminal domain-containing protein [Cryobacterium sp. 10C2]